MSARLIFSGGLAVLALMPYCDPGEARSKKPCASKGSVTVHGTERVRIIKTKHTLYACDRRAKRKMRLGPRGDFPGKTVSNLRVAGYFVAYTLHATPASSQGPFGDTDVRWVDLRHGKRLNPSTGCARRNLVSDGNKVSRLVLSATGAMAWVCSDVAASEVHKLDRLGPNTLDTFYGPPWDMSLDLGESLGVTVYWANLDGLHSSRLIGFQSSRAGRL